MEILVQSDATVWKFRRVQVLLMAPTLSYFVKTHSGEYPSTTQGLCNRRVDFAFDTGLCPAHRPNYPGWYSFCRKHLQYPFDISFCGNYRFSTAEHLGCYGNKNVNTCMPKARPRLSLLLQTPAVSAGCSKRSVQQVWRPQWTPGGLMWHNSI